MSGYQRLAGLLGFLEAAKDAPSQEALGQCVGDALAPLGFSGWAYQAPAREAHWPPLILHNFPQAWVEHYAESQFHKIDPVVVVGCRLITSFRWSSLAEARKPTKVVRDYLGEANDQGLRDGIGIPIINSNRPHAMFSLSSACRHAEIDQLIAQHSHELTAIAYAFHNLAQQLAPAGPISAAVYLTNREKECLVWSSTGKTSWEIGAILKLSERTVNFHLGNAKRKLGATSRQQAIAIAICDGHISP